MKKRDLSTLAVLVVLLCGCAGLAQRSPLEARQSVERCPVHNVAFRKGPGKLPHGMTVNWLKEVYDAMEKYPYVRRGLWDSKTTQYCELCEEEVDNTVRGMLALLGVSCIHTDTVGPLQAECIAEQFLRQSTVQNQELIDAQKYTPISTQDGWAVVVAPTNRVWLFQVEASTAEQARDIAQAKWTQSGKEVIRIGFLPFQTTGGWCVAVGKHEDFVVIYVDENGAITKTPGWTE